jgi:Putative zinc-finger
MPELTCAEVRDLSTEYALGVLPALEARPLEAHLAGCARCRRETDEMATLGTHLLDLIPGTEPPLGFDRRVLAAVRSRPRRHRRTLIASIAAAAVVVAGTAAGVAASSGGGRGGSEAYEQLIVSRAPLYDGTRTVGDIWTSGRPSWLHMTVHDLDASGPVTCELVGPNGTITSLGSFGLVHGSGSWGAPVPQGTDDAVAARLVDASGRVVARGNLT